MKINQKAINARLTSTYEGGSSYNLTPEHELLTFALTTFFGEDTFYTTGNQDIIKLRNCIDNLVVQGKGEFVAKTAMFARNSMNMRTVSIAILVELANSLRVNKQKLSNLYKYITKTISRADELTDIYAYALKVFGNKKLIPNSIKKGVKEAFAKFDAYSLKKYEKSDSQVKLRDVMMITHPFPKDEVTSKTYKQLLEGSLPAISTWETVIATEGSTTENWQQIANNPKTGYMALLRNLRNFVEKNVILDKVIERISSKEEVKKSKQFPYRFYSAFREIKELNRFDTGKVLDALETAFDYSIDNIPNLGNVAVVCDMSASMNSPPSSRSKISMKEIAAVNAVAMAKSAANYGNNACIVGFADNAKIYTINSKISSMRFVDILGQEQLGGGTYIDTAFKEIRSNLSNVDTIVVFSDMQMSSFRTPELSIANKIAFNLQHYGNSPLVEIEGWKQFTGFSDKVYEFINLSRDLNALVYKVNNTTL